MRHVNGRTLDLLITTLLPDTALTNLSQRLLSISSGIWRCTNCQRFRPAYTMHPIHPQSTRRIARPSPLSPYSFSAFGNTPLPAATRRFVSSLPTIVDATEMTNSATQPVKGEPRKGERLRENSMAIIAFASNGRVNEALERYFYMLGTGGFPSQEALYQLARALYRASNLAGMYALHDTLLLYYKVNLPSKRQLRSMMYMYTMMITLIGRKNNILPKDMEKIRKLCGEMETLNIKTTIVLYNNLIKLFVTMKDYGGAYALYEELLRKNMKPTHYTYSILMLASAQQRDLEKIVQLMDAMEEHQVLPDRAIVSILVDVLSNIREFDSAMELTERAYTLMESTEMGAKFRNHLRMSITKKRHNFTLKKHKRYMLKKAKKRTLRDI